MTQNPSPSVNSPQPKNFIRSTHQHHTVNNPIIPSLKITHADTPGIVLKSSSTSCKNANPIPSLNSRVADFHSTPANLPNIIRNQEMALRQRTFNTFLKSRSKIDDLETRPKPDYQAIGRNSSVKQVQNLANVAKQRDLSWKKNFGVMYVNELWDDRSYKTILKKSGIQAYKESIEKQSRAPFPDRRDLFMRFFEEKHNQGSLKVLGSNNGVSPQEDTGDQHILLTQESMPEKSFEMGLSSYRMQRMLTDPNDLSPSIDKYSNYLNFSDVAEKRLFGPDVIQHAKEPEAQNYVYNLFLLF